MKKLISAFLAIGLVFMACPTGNGSNGNIDEPPIVPPIIEPPVTPVEKQPGRFSATVLSDAMGSNARSVSLGTYTVSNSKSIFFILRNVGDFPITNITLTPGKLLVEGEETFEPITGNGIVASPGAITVLETSGNATVETVIEVNINHGNVVGLISQQYIQKADFAGATLRIAGETTNDEDEILDVTLDVDIETFIKVASFEVYYSVDDGDTYVKAEYGYPKRWDNTDDIISPRFIVPSAGLNHVKIYNSGNTLLRYAVMGTNDTVIWMNQAVWKTLGIDSRSDVLTKTPYVNERCRFVIDTLGVAFDNNGITSFVFVPDSSIVYDNAALNSSTPYIDIGLPNAD